MALVELVVTFCPKLPCCEGDNVLLWLNDPSLLVDSEVLETTITNMIYLNSSEVQYTLEYDDSLLTDPGTPVTPEDIKKPCCENCNTQLIRELPDPGEVVIFSDDTIDGDGTALDPLTVPPSLDADNQLVLGTDNQLYVGPTAIPAISPIDTNSIDLTVSGGDGHTLKADVIISPDADNALEERANGLYATAGGGGGSPLTFYSTVRDAGDFDRPAHNGANVAGQVLTTANLTLDMFGDAAVDYASAHLAAYSYVNGEVIGGDVTVELYLRVFALNSALSVVSFFSRVVRKTFSVGLQSVHADLPWIIYTDPRDVYPVNPTQFVYADATVSKLSGAGDFQMQEVDIGPGLDLVLPFYVRVQAREVPVEVL